uniref:Poly(A) polymerase nucleotidyltransferase domain-containing protein n=1 Tax=Zea mays TaxID=4577 RepID=A0A804MQF3_MAIZE
MRPLPRRHARELDCPPPTVACHGQEDDNLLQSDAPLTGPFLIRCSSGCGAAGFEAVRPGAKGTVLEETQLKFEEERQNLLKVLPNNSKELSVRRVCEGCGMSKVKNNNGYHGVTEPISLSGPTEKYLMQTAEVEKYLSDARLYERQDEAILREEVLGKLDQVEQFSTEIYYFASFKIFFSLAAVDEGTTSRQERLEAPVFAWELHGEKLLAENKLQPDS